jgi:hypothetical protein
VDELLPAVLLDDDIAPEEVEVCNALIFESFGL